MRIVLLLLFIFVTILCLYITAAGWMSAELLVALRESNTSSNAPPVIYDGISWFNGVALRQYTSLKEAEQWFPLFVHFPQPIALMMTSLACGSVGGVMRVSHDHVRAKTPLSGHDFAVVGQSALMGLLVLGISSVVPAAITISETTVRPVALLFLCVFGGIFHNQIFNWAEKQFQKLLSVKTGE